MSRTIKKYANRRLYDTQDSRYVTLAEVRAMIAAGEPVRVIEEKTGNDVTRAILVQIVSEQEVLGQPLLSEDLLRNIIRYYDNPMRELARGYLEQSFQQFESQQRQLMEQWQRMMEQSPLATFTDLAKANTQAFASLQKTFLDNWLNKADDKNS